MLYPLKFTPIMKEVVWGGERLAAAGKRVPRGVNPKRIGESWEISGLEGAESKVSEGVLKGNTLGELIEVYMGELVGDNIYDRYGLEFPILTKFIDTRDKLSVQVHPNDEFAAEMHGTRGKTEIWYIIDAAPDGAIYLDVNRSLSEDEYDRAVEEGCLDKYLKKRLVHKGEAYLVPAGTIHSIGGGVLLAEVQEASDVTYRIFDWNRLDQNGHPRELHTALAAEVVGLTPHEGLNITKDAKTNGAVELASSELFTVNLLKVDGAVEMDYAPLDSFVAFMCVEGGVSLRTMGQRVELAELETVLVPAEATDVLIEGKGRLLEIFVKS